MACFHVWFGKVSGGVDVFLTLSGGYFFLGSLLRHAIYAQKPNVTFRDTLNPWPRLKRLLKRLLPALVTVLLAVTVLTVVILPQTRWANIGQEVVASALYYQNWYLALNSQDYLAASSANSPLQHIWSMSMQGQFFVLTLLVALAFAGFLKVAARLARPFADPRVIKFLVGAAVFVVALGGSFYWAHRGWPSTSRTTTTPRSRGSGSRSPAACWRSGCRVCGCRTGCATPRPSWPWH